MRLLIIFFLIYLLYRGLKSWLLTNMTYGRFKEKGHPLTNVDDIMVQDPFCKVYFPKRKGVRLEFEGEQLYFCSVSCRDRFLLERKNSKTREKS
jgi:YHS domain-containing protein